MTDGEFLDALQKRAATRSMVSLSLAELARLCAINSHRISSCFSDASSCTIAASDLYQAVLKARMAITAAVKARLKG